MRDLVETPAMQRAVARYDEAFPAVWLEETARETGFVKRTRDFDPVLFYWALVLRTGIYLQVSLAAVERGYNRHAERALAHATLYEKYTPELVDFLRGCVARGIEYLGTLQANRLSPRLDVSAGHGQVPRTSHFSSVLRARAKRLATASRSYYGMLWGCKTITD